MKNNSIFAAVLTTVSILGSLAILINLATTPVEAAAAAKSAPASGNETLPPPVSPGMQPPPISPGMMAPPIGQGMMGPPISPGMQPPPISPGNLPPPPASGNQTNPGTFSQPIVPPANGNTSGNTSGNTTGNSTSGN